VKHNVGRPAWAPFNNADARVPEPAAVGDQHVIERWRSGPAISSGDAGGRRASRERELSAPVSSCTLEKPVPATLGTTGSAAGARRARAAVSRAPDHDGRS